MRVKVPGPVTPEMVSYAFNYVYDKYVKNENLVDVDTGEPEKLHISTVNLYITLKDSSGNIVDPKNNELLLQFKE